MKRRSRLRKDRSGSAALEFAFVLWPFFAMIFAMVDLSHYLLAQHSLDTLTAEISRAMIINCGTSNTNSPGQLSASCTTNPLTTAQQQAIAPILYAGSATPNISVSNSANVITVSASMSTFPTLVPWWGSIVGSLASTTTMHY